MIETSDCVNHGYQWRMPQKDMANETEIALLARKIISNEVICPTFPSMKCIHPSILLFSGESFASGFSDSGSQDRKLPSQLLWLPINQKTGHSILYSFPSVPVRSTTKESLTVIGHLQDARVPKIFLTVNNIDPWCRCAIIQTKMRKRRLQLLIMSSTEDSFNC